MSDLAPRPTPGSLDPTPIEPAITYQNELGKQLAEEFRPFDDAALEILSPDELAAQLAVREELWAWTDQLWHRANAQPDGVAPALTSLRELTIALRDHAREVSNAGNED